MPAYFWLHSARTVVDMCVHKRAYSDLCYEPSGSRFLSIFNSVGCAMFHKCGHTKAAADSCYGPLGSRSLSIFVSINPVGGRQARKGMSRIPCPEICTQKQLPLPNFAIQLNS
jgi:hypothetical protein